MWFNKIEETELPAEELRKKLRRKPFKYQNDHNSSRAKCDTFTPKVFLLAHWYRVHVPAFSTVDLNCLPFSVSLHYTFKSTFLYVILHKYFLPHTHVRGQTGQISIGVVVEIENLINNNKRDDYKFRQIMINNFWLRSTASRSGFINDVPFIFPTQINRNLNETCYYLLLPSTTILTPKRPVFN